MNNFLIECSFEAETYPVKSKSLIKRRTPKGIKAKKM